MRELTRTEVTAVSGGFLGLPAGLIAAGVTGGVGGASYALTTNNFSWGGFAIAAGTAASSGFMIGTGATMFVAAARGVVGLGSSVIGGTTLMGAGSAVGTVGGVALQEREGGSGG